MTAICDNWVSRVLHKGEDPYGLGRWSYVTLRGKGSIKITVITAYNATPSPGDSTYHHQQLRVLSRFYREQNIPTPPNPRRQFMLDLQAWIESLQSEQHQIILCLNANETYDPDQEYLSHPLPFNPERLTVDSAHNGKLSTLVTSCGLCLPLAQQHSTRPFPASHISGRNQIDFNFVSRSIQNAVQRSGVLSHHSLVRRDHHPYYLDFDSSIILFDDPAYKIEPAMLRKLRLQDPRVINQYNNSFNKLLD